MENVYVLQFLKKQINISSVESPESFVLITKQLYDLFLPQSTTHGFQIWMQDGVFIPLYGVEKPNTMLLEEVIETAQGQFDLSKDLGELILNNHRLWSRELRTILKNDYRRSTDRARVSTLKRRIDLVRHIFCEIEKEKVKEIDVCEIYEYMTSLDRPSVQSMLQKLNVSKSAFYRHQEILCKTFGAWAMEYLSRQEIDELRSE